MIGFGASWLLRNLTCAHTELPADRNSQQPASYSVYVVNFGVCDIQKRSRLPKEKEGHRTATRCNAMYHTATRCNAMQHTATYCSILEHTAMHCSTLQHTPLPTASYTATRCNTLQHPATHTASHCNILQHSLQHTAAHTATRCNTLQCTVENVCSVLQCVAVCCSVTIVLI